MEVRDLPFNVQVTSYTKEETAPMEETYNWLKSSNVEVRWIIPGRSILFTDPTYNLRGVMISTPQGMKIIRKMPS